MPCCAFRTCSKSTRNTSKSEGVTFHSFPQDPRFKEKWIKIIQRDRRDEEWLPTKFSRICSAHFSEDDYKMTPVGRRKIKLTAIPSLQSDECLPDIKEEAESDSSLRDVYVSDSESIFDTPTKIHLKKQLSAEKEKRARCQRVIMKLRRQNKYLKAKNISLRELIRSLKSKKDLNQEN